VIGGQVGTVLAALGPVVEEICPGLSTRPESISSEPAHTVPERTGPDGGSVGTGRSGKFAHESLGASKAAAYPPTR
jgi:hypothetical protein